MSSRNGAGPNSGAQEFNALQRLLLEHCANTGDTLADIAERGGLARQTVSAMLHRDGPRSLPRTATLTKLADGLGVSLRVVREAASEAAYGPSNGRPADHRLAVLQDTAGELSSGAVDVLLATARALRALDDTP